MFRWALCHYPIFDTTLPKKQAAVFFSIIVTGILVLISVHWGTGGDHDCSELGPIFHSNGGI